MSKTSSSESDVSEISGVTEETGTVRYTDVFPEIEKKWQARWQDAAIYRSDESSDREKYYVLDMFPYPSGSGLHVGHCKNYVPGDVVARLMSMRGKNVLHPMGWDAFGQPAEQDAIKRNVNPRTVVPILAETYKQQMSLLGIGYDWSREINSTDPEYYRWNQWAFLLLHERGLVYRKNAPVNWCVDESTILANEEVVDGRCWRCDGPVVKRDMLQWFFRITAYGDKLIEGLDRIDWPEGIKTQQRDWIGRSEGCEFDIAIADVENAIVRVFTTRVDTVYGMAFVVLSPEHALVDQITTDAQRAEVNAYRTAAAGLSEQDRTDEKRERTGVFTGAYAINPVNGHQVPVWIADYVLAGYGTGAIMAVPAHDDRDFDFARRYDLPTPIVIVATPEEVANPGNGADLKAAFVSKEGYLVNSGDFTDLPSKIAAHRITELLESKGIGEAKTNYRLRDWLVSRQRYWGTPIPIIHCPACGAVPVPVQDLPVLLPDVENYKPNADGRSPLATIPEFVKTTCPVCGGPAERETDTMAGSVDSSWYFLRFTSPQDHTHAWDRAASDYWMPVDRYLGGREHAVGHLLYARFFTKVFYDAGLISTDEPFQSLRNQGMLLGYTPVERYFNTKLQKDDFKAIKPEELPGYDFATWSKRFEESGPFSAERVVKQTDQSERVEPVRIEYQWLKMSKSKGNAVTPDDMAAKYGADALRMYVLFEAPFEDTIQWDEARMSGTFRFLSRVYETVTDIAPNFDTDWASKIGEAKSAEEKALRRKTHQAIAKVGNDVEKLGFNTAVSALMIFADGLRKFVASNGTASPAAHEAAETMAKLLAPLAPHVADEMYERLGHTGKYLYREAWPVFDPSVAAEEEVTVVVQINGKLRDKIVLPADADAKVCEMAALASDKIQAETNGKTIRKIVVVPGKLVNIVAN